jgi:hypothetical protein
MAFKLRSPLYKDDDKNKINFTTPKKPTASPSVQRASLGNALSQVNAQVLTLTQKKKKLVLIS